MAIAFAKLIVMMKDIIFLITNVKNVLLYKIRTRYRMNMVDTAFESPDHALLKFINHLSESLN